MKRAEKEERESGEKQTKEGRNDRGGGGRQREREERKGGDEMKSRRNRRGRTQIVLSERKQHHSTYPHRGKLCNKSCLTGLHVSGITAAQSGCQLLDLP